MKKLALALMFLISLCSAQNKEEIKKSSKITVNPQNISFEGENIFIEFKGEYYPVRLLVKHGGEWLATIDEKNAFCPRGHNVCGFCDQCHTPECPYAVLPPCWVGK